MIKNLVLSAGGVKGFTYLGAFKALKELGIWDDIENICTSSCGSMIGLGLVLGFTYKELINISNELFKLELLKSKNKLDIFEIYNNFGLEDGYGLIKLIDLLIEKKTGVKDATFSDLNNFFPNKHLIVTVTNLSQHRVEYLSFENSPDLKVSKAIRMSISIPLIFNKVIYKGDHYSDGGILSSIPIDYFRNDIENTLILSLESLRYYTDINTLGDYLLRIWDLGSSTVNDHIIEKYKANTINLIVDLGLLNFEINNSQKKYLYETGYIQTYKLLKFTKFKHYLEIKTILDNIINSIIE